MQEIKAEKGPIPGKLLLPGMPAIPDVNFQIGLQQPQKFVRNQVKHCKHSPSLVAINTALKLTF